MNEGACAVFTLLSRVVWANMDSHRAQMRRISSDTQSPALDEHLTSLDIGS
jgi:hypothetical protein